MSPLRIYILVLVLGLMNTSFTWANNGPSLTQKQALGLVLQSEPGKVISNELVAKNDSFVYRVRILTPEGVVKTFFVDIDKGSLINDDEK